MTGNDQDEDAQEKQDGIQQLSMFEGVSPKPKKEKVSPARTKSAAKSPSKTPVKTQAETPIEASVEILGNPEIKEKSAMQTVEPGIDFEASLTKLEAVVKELDGEVKLEEALKLFEEGIKLSVECEKFIKSAEQKIEILKKTADGSIEAESFAHESEKLLAGD